MNYGIFYIFSIGERSLYNFSCNYFFYEISYCLIWSFSNFKSVNLSSNKGLKSSSAKSDFWICFYFEKLFFFFCYFFSKASYCSSSSLKTFLISSFIKSDSCSKSILFFKFVYDLSIIFFYLIFPEFVYDLDFSIYKPLFIKLLLLL